MNTTGLLKVLTGAGIGSRRLMACAIKEGRVQVNQETATGFNFAVDINTDTITIDGRPVKTRAAPFVYLVLNKPAGVLSTTSDQQKRATVADYIPARYRHIKVFPVGRLDKNSTGLILLTNDGQLAYRLSHPRFEHEKEYQVGINHKLSLQDKDRIENGIMLDDGITHPARVKAVEESSRYIYSITIHEGRKHIVRRMLARLGYTVLYLKRVRLSNIYLGELSEGNTRPLTTLELEKLTGYKQTLS